jgi:nucleoside 2-deoxyribosyltransferase
LCYYDRGCLCQARLASHNLARLTVRILRKTVEVESEVNKVNQASREKGAKSVFVVCEPGSDIHALTDTMHSLGLRPLNLEYAFQSNLSVTGNTWSLIADADLICAALKETNSPNVYLELGYALGLQRPTIVISDASSLPADLADLLWIKAPLNDRTAIEFQLRAALQNVDGLRPRRQKKRSRDSSKRIPPSEKIMGSRVPQTDTERQLLATLEASNDIESIVMQPRGTEDWGYVPDFAVWLASSAGVIGSPMIIELKTGPLSHSSLEKAVDQLQTYARASGVKSVLLIHDSPREPKTKVLSLSPLTFALAFDEVRRLLVEGRLVEALGRERNRFAHSAN